MAVAASILVPAKSAAQGEDPAMTFVAKLILGQKEEAQKLILEPVSQATNQPGIPGKLTLSPREFLDAVGDCQIGKFENRDYFPRTSAKLEVVWDCERFALAARVRSVGDSVDISEFQKRLYVPG
jgi:hypothetical protein